MKVNDIKVAVKTQKGSAARRYRLAWTFQNVPERRDPIHYLPEAWAGLMVFKVLKEVTECLVYAPRKIKQRIFEAPRPAKLVGREQAAYLETLVKPGIMPERIISPAEICGAQS